MLVSGTYLTMVRVERIDQLTSPQITVNTITKTNKTTPTPAPPSPKLRAAYGALNACSHLTPTHQLAEGHHETSPCTAPARNLAYTAARGQGAQKRAPQRILNPAARGKSCFSGPGGPNWMEPGLKPLAMHMILA